MAAELGVTPTQLKTWRLELEAAGSVAARAAQKAGAAAKLARAASRPSQRTFRTSVETVQRTYVSLESAAETYQYGDQYNRVLDLSEREAANSAGAMNAMLGNPEPSDGAENIRSTTLDPILTLISADLPDRWHGALFSLNPNNPDAARHFCTSAREILTRILDLSTAEQNRSKGRRKTGPFSVMRYAVLRVVPLVHRRAPRCFA